jgi:hypothetical protein
MAHITADRVRDTSTSTSTGNFVVSGTAPTGFRTLSAVLSASDTFYYVIQGQGTSEWEVGIGTYSSANTFARTTVLSSSNSGSAVNFSAGTKDVFLTLAAARTVQLDNNGAIPGITDDGNLTFTGTARRITGDFSNGTIASRLMLQTSTANTFTVVRAIPSGTGNYAEWSLGNNSDQGAATSTGLFSISTSEVRLSSNQANSGTVLPLTFHTNGLERMRVATDGSVSVGGSLSSGGTVSMSSSFMRNRIINGNFDIWQRGTSFTLTSGGAYGPDRWVGGAASGSISRQAFANGQTEVPGNPTYYARYIISTNSQNYEWQQKIEGVSSFAGQTATVSFYARQTTGTVTLGGRIVQDFGTGGSPSSLVVTALGNPSLTTSWQKFTFTVAIPSISGKTIGTDKNDNVWLSLQVSNTGTGTIDFAQFQMEEGSVATPFERLQLTQIVQQCQRFYQKSYAIDVDPGTSSTGGYASNPGHAGGTGNSRANIRFATEMRAAPTLAYWDLVGNINRSSTFVSNNTQSNNISSASFNLTGIGTSGFAFNNAGGTGSAGSGAWASACHWTASAEF